jgi:hypothetical protein
MRAAIQPAARAEVKFRTRDFAPADCDTQRHSALRTGCNLPKESRASMNNKVNMSKVSERQSRIP